MKSKCGAPVSQIAAHTKEGIIVDKMKNETLIQKAKMKNSDAFAELMKSQMQSMYRTAKAILMNDEDVADAIQDTLLICDFINSANASEFFIFAF